MTSGEENVPNSEWKLCCTFSTLVILFGFLLYHISDLQINKGEEMLERSKNNQLRIRKGRCVERGFT